MAAGVAAFAIGMLTYDAFSFIQVTFVLFILMALAASAVLNDEPWEEMSARPSVAKLRRRKRQ